MIKNKSLFELKLEALRKFQEKNPTSHVGGSIGLFLQGIELPRDLSKSDLDVVVDENFNCEEALKEYRERSDTTDFDLNIEADHGSGYYTKIDVRISPEPSYTTAFYNGHQYNVSLIRNILFWKRKYAAKGVKKHIADIYFIEAGKPMPDPVNVVNSDDDLPF
jgi:hypothetical protein